MRNTARTCSSFVADKLMFSGAILLLAAAMDAVSRQSANFSRGGGGT